MEYKIKTKLINGKVMYGIINDQLEVVLPFKYANIEEKSYERKSMYESGTRKYYILSNSDNKKGIFDGKSLIEPTYDYIDYIPLFDNEYWSKFIVGQQSKEKMEYGILERQPNRDGSCNYNMVYPFGKADEIKVENGKVVLYKNKGDRVLRGVFNDSQIGTYDPKYTRLDLRISKPIYTPIMPDPKRYFAADNVRWSFGFQEWPIKYIEYGMVKNRRETKGILVRDVKYGEYSGQDIWNELVPCEYTDFSIDTQENLIELLKVKNKRKLKGLMGFSTYWHIGTKGSAVEGNCTYIPEFTIPCEFDDISLFYDKSEHYYRDRTKLFLVKKDGKYGLLKVHYSLARGPYDNYNNSLAASVEVLLECKYDRISYISNKDNIVFTSAGKKGLLINDYYDKDKKALQTSCEYKSIDSISDNSYKRKFVITDFNDKKSIFIPYEENCNDYGFNGYKFKQTPFEYDSILEKGILQCSKRVDEIQHYDIYDSYLNLIVDNVDSVSFEDNICKTSTNIGEDITRIMFFETDGKVLLDEQGKNISAAYSAALHSFIISRDNIIQVKKSLHHVICEKDVDIQGDYTVFDFTENGLVKFKKAKENSKMGVYRLIRDSDIWSVRYKIRTLLNDEYDRIDIVANGTRSIVSKIIDCDIPIIKYGVMENIDGNECIPIEYDFIIFDGENFITSNYEDDATQQIKFDSDGFYLCSETLGGQKYKKYCNE